MYREAKAESAARYVKAFNSGLAKIEAAKRAGKSGEEMAAVYRDVGRYIVCDLRERGFDV